MSVRINRLFSCLLITSSRIYVINMAAVSWPAFLLGFHSASGVGHVGWGSVKTLLEHPYLTAEEKQYMFLHCVHVMDFVSNPQLLEVVNGDTYSSKYRSLLLYLLANAFANHCLSGNASSQSSAYSYFWIKNVACCASMSHLSLLRDIQFVFSHPPSRYHHRPLKKHFGRPLINMKWQIHPLQLIWGHMQS